MLNPIDRFLNSVTMYRLVMYELFLLILAGFVYSFFGLMPFQPLELAVSTAVLLAVCWISNEAFARIFRAHPNTESVYISSFILTLVITPVAFSSLPGFVFIVVAGIAAMGSKYILAIRRKHVFNPVAAALVLTYFTGIGYASWWVGGNFPMLPFVVIMGLLIVRKIRRFDLVLSFVVAATASIYFTSNYASPFLGLDRIFLHTSLLFFAFVMITEPLTTPPTRSLRIMYGVLVGLVFAPSNHIGDFHATPEIALVIGNLFSYAISPKWRGLLTLTGIREIGANIYELVFESPRAYKFSPGQYMEWTLSHKKPDLRGNRRYFTVASSPTEPVLRLGVRVQPKDGAGRSSTFKQALIAMKPGDKIMAGQLAGDFTLPRENHHKLAFIAGGIGVTPFRSMAQYLIDSGEKRDSVLLYSNKTVDEAVYREVFREAHAKAGLRTVYFITDEKIPQPPEDIRNEFITRDAIMREISDYKERVFYISGTNAMVKALTQTLREMGVPPTRIKKDFFPGFA